MKSTSHVPAKIRPCCFFQIVTSDEMLFSDDVIKIEPVNGDIWPNSTAEINVVFRPDEAKTYTRTAFCDVTGRESRLPLRIRGDGVGPKVQFSFDDLDMGNIFVNSMHTYEVVIANNGDIDAIFSIIPSKSVFGPCFVFNPSEGIVMPEGHQAIQVTYCYLSVPPIKFSLFRCIHVPGIYSCLYCWSNLVSQLHFMFRRQNTF